MPQIMRRFQWTWAGLLFTDDAYGGDAAQICQWELARSGWGCLAYAQALPWDNDPAQTQSIVSVMKKSTARVVVVIAYGIHMVKLMDEVRVVNSCIIVGTHKAICPRIGALLCACTQTFTY